MNNQKGYVVLISVMFVGTLITTMGYIAISSYTSMLGESQRYRRAIAAYQSMTELGGAVAQAYQVWVDFGSPLVAPFCPAGFTALSSNSAVNNFCFIDNGTQETCISHPFQNAAGTRTLCLTPAPSNDIQVVAKVEIRERTNEPRWKSWVAIAREVLPNFLGLAVGKFVSTAVAQTSAANYLPASLAGAPTAQISYPYSCTNTTTYGELCMRCNPPGLAAPGGASASYQPCINLQVCLWSDVAPCTNNWLFQKFAILAN